MKSLFSASALVFVYILFALSSCSTQDDMTAKPAAPAAPAPVAKVEQAPPAEKALEEKAEKAKATKVVGDVGLLDLEKNYMILVTKEGKLVTVDFDAKTKATQIDPSPDRARSNLALLLLQEAKPSAALDQAREAVRR